MLAPGPSYTEDDLEAVLVTKSKIQRRVAELGRELSRHYDGRDVTIVAILSGALVFAADLIRSCDFPTRLDCLRAESYGNLSIAAGPPRITNPLKTEIAGQHVLVVDDILDSGNTLRAITTHLQGLRPASLETCVLLDKPARHEPAFTADYVGFTIPDQFVVGYGLDFAERYRNLSCIGVLKKELQRSADHA